MNDNQAPKGRLTLGIVVQVPRGKENDSYAAINHTFVERSVDVHTVTCTQEEAQKIAATFKAQNGTARTFAAWTGEVAL